MNRKEKRAKQKILDRMNKQYCEKLVPVLRQEWPEQKTTGRSELLLVFRNNKFLVQVFKENEMIRISVNRTDLKPDGGWQDDITWDDLQDIKREIGFGNKLAVEIYPRDVDIVNVANIRHLWIMDDNIELGWKRS